MASQIPIAAVVIIIIAGAFRLGPFALLIVSWPLSRIVGISGERQSRDTECRLFDYTGAADEGTRVVVDSVYSGVSVHSAEMFVEVFFPREPRAAAPFAVVVRADIVGFGPAMSLVHFALVTEEAAGVCEALDFLAPGFFAYVRSGVFVSVFASVTTPRYHHVKFTKTRRAGPQPAFCGTEKVVELT